MSCRLARTAGTRNGAQPGAPQACTPTWDAKSATVAFRCTNLTPGPVRLTASSGCGCLVAVPDENPLAAGATGVVSATLQIGYQSGSIAKTVSITTDPPGAGPQVLTVLALVPMPLVIRPGFVHWMVGDPLEERSVTVAIADGIPARVIEVRPSTEAIQVDWKPGDDGTGVLRIIPRSTGLPWNSTVIIRTNSARDFLIFCRCVAADAIPAGTRRGSAR